MNLNTNSADYHEFEYSHEYSCAKNRQIFSFDRRGGGRSRCCCRSYSRFSRRATREQGGGQCVAQGPRLVRGARRNYDEQKLEASLGSYCISTSGLQIVAQPWPAALPRACRPELARYAMVSMRQICGSITLRDSQVPSERTFWRGCLLAR